MQQEHKELKELKEYASSKGHEGNLEHWDVPYWAERLREERFDYSDEELRPYFALPAVLDGLFQLIERLFGVTVEAADGKAEVWNDDVRFFEVKDEDKVVASFYLDPYSRPADKRGGAWMDVCVGKSKALKRDVPTAYLTCNGSPPVGDKPSLMTFDEVNTLYHEMGHGLQHMLTKVEDGDAVALRASIKFHDLDAVDATYFAHRRVLMEWSGTPWNCRRSSWRTGCWIARRSTASPSTTRRASRCRTSFMISSRARRRTTRAWP